MIKDKPASVKINQAKVIPLKRRSKGDITREKILMSTIEVLALNGIKGTTHRAIASHADLPLSLTTYYFKDIQTLIQQAFELNSLDILSRKNPLLKAAYTAISNLDKKELRKKTVKEALCQQLSEMISVHLINNIKHQAISLSVEQLMLTESQVSSELRLLSETHESTQLVPYELICRFFNKINPELDAKIMYTVLSQLQYSQLSKQVCIETTLIEQTTRKIIAWIMSVK